MWPDEKSVLIALQAEITAVHHKGRALINAGLNEVEDVVFGGSGNHGTVIHVLSRRVGPNFQFFDPRHQFFNQAVCGLIAHWNRNGNCHTAFACGTIAGSDQGICRLIHIRIRHDNHVVFGSAKALHPFAV